MAKKITNKNTKQNKSWFWENNKYKGVTIGDTFFSLQ